MKVITTTLSTVSLRLKLALYWLTSVKSVATSPGSSIPQKFSSAGKSWRQPASSSANASSMAGKPVPEVIGGSTGPRYK